jgi:hypothetical protein
MEDAVRRAIQEGVVARRRRFRILARS